MSYARTNEFYCGQANPCLFLPTLSGRCIIFCGVFIPEDEERSITQLQLDLAEEFGRRQPFHCIVWIPPNLQPTSTKQQRFVDYLMTADLPKVRLLQTNIEDLKTYIYYYIKRHTRPMPTGESSFEK